MRERTKDVEIDGVKYQISKLSVMTAMWIATQVITKVMPMNVESKMSIPALPQGRDSMTEEEFSQLLYYCLMACSKYEMTGTMEMAMPIMTKKGVWSFPDMEYDPVIVISLLIHVLEFNIATFFSERVLKQLSETFQGITLFSTLR